MLQLFTEKWEVGMGEEEEKKKKKKEEDWLIEDILQAPSTMSGDLRA